MIGQDTCKSRIGALAIAALMTIAPLSGTAFAMGSGGGTETPQSASDPFEASYNSAVALINKNDLDGAITALNKLNADYPKNSDILNYLGYTHRQKGLYDEARSYYDQALALNPSHRGANEYLGELYLQIKDLAAAEAQLEKLNDLCTFGCAEYRELKKKIEAYRASS